MKKILLSFITAVLSISGYAAIAPNSIMFTGVNTESATDQFSFIIFEPIAVGEVIRFTDKAWTTATGPLAASEGVITLTVTTAIPAGVQLVIQVNGATVSLPTGAGSATVMVSGTFSLAEDGDQILCYQGSDATPIFFAGITIGVPWITTGSTSTNTSYLPTGIPNVALTGGNPPNSASNNNAVITTPVNGTAAAVLAALQNPVNWSLQSAQYVLPPVGVLSLLDVSTFTVQPNNGNALITIKFNNIPYEAYVQKSTNGISFTNIALLNQSKLLYTVEDRLTATKTYYRLVLKTATGTTQYSEILNVYNASDNNSVIFNSYPNPVKQQINIPYNVPNKSTLHIKMVNSTGAIVWQQTNTVMQGQGIIAVNATNIQAGAYVLMITNNNDVISVQRIIKQ